MPLLSMTLMTTVARRRAVPSLGMASTGKVLPFFESSPFYIYLFVLHVSMWVSPHTTISYFEIFPADSSFLFSPCSSYSEQCYAVTAASAASATAPVAAEATALTAAAQRWRQQLRQRRQQLLRQRRQQLRLQRRQQLWWQRQQLRRQRRQQLWWQRRQRGTTSSSVKIDA